MNRVKDILRTKGHRVWSIRPDATVYEALELLAEKNVGAVLVMEDSRLVGIFSERDYARKVVLHGKASKKVASRMKMVVDDIEERFSEHLVEWDGDLDKVRGVNEMVKKLYSKAPAVPQGLLGLRR